MIFSQRNLSILITLIKNTYNDMAKYFNAYFNMLCDYV